MNKIYKVIWSKARGCYVVVSEYAWRNGKSAARAVMAGVAAMMLLGSATVYAESPTYDSLTVTDGATVGGDLEVTGETSTGTLAVTDGATIGGDLEVTGETSTGTLAVTGDAEVGGDLAVTGETSLKDTTVDGKLTTTNATVTGVLEADSEFVNNITVNENATVDGMLTAANANVTGNATVDGMLTATDAEVTGNATVDGMLTAANADVTGNANVGEDLSVGGDTSLDGSLEVNGTSTFNDDVTVNANESITGDLSVGGDTALAGSLTVDGTSTFNDDVTVNANESITGDLSVGGNAVVTGDMTAQSYKVGDKTYISSDGINANSQKVTNVADGELSATSTDAVNGSQLYETNQRVDKLGTRINKVGAAAAAMANLHPIDDPDSKFNMAAAVGNYRSETAAAIGLFYKPTDKIQLNMSTALGNSENMFGAGVTFALDRTPKREKEGTKVKELQAKVDDQQAQIDNLQAKLDALLSALGQDNQLPQAAE